MAVLDHVGDARGRAPVVFKHMKRALAVTHQIGPVDVNIGAVRRIEANHFRPVIAVLQHQRCGNRTIIQDMALVIHIPQEHVQRPHPLYHASLDDAPFRGHHDPRDDIKRQYAIYRVLVAVDGEGDGSIWRLAAGNAPRPVSRFSRTLSSGKISRPWGT